MSKSIQIARWLYRCSLSLYPHEFRAAFGDEMTVVFTRALGEAAEEGGGGLARFCLREVGALLSSVAREQIAAYRARRLMPAGEGVVMQSPNQMLYYRLSVSTILILIIAVCLLIILPFFALGLHLEPASFVAGGAYDPKGYAVFQSGIGCAARIVGMCALALVLPGVTGFGLSLVLMAGRGWRTWNGAQRRLTVLMLVISAGIFAFLFSDAGRVVVAWYLD